MKKMTQDKLKELLHYDSRTGVFTWLTRPAFRIKIGDIAGSVDHGGYVQIRIEGENYLAHRLAWMYIYGYFPESSMDHINRDKIDNSIKNLREASSSCNARNRGIRRDNKSGVIGVGWHKASRSWRSYITVSGKTLHLGLFNDLIDATIARWCAEIKFNFPVCNTTSSAYLYITKQQHHILTREK